MDKQFTADEIRDHKGTVEIFCPHIEHHKSTYSIVINTKVEDFIQRAFAEDSSFRPVGRIEGKRMLICMLPHRSD
jgi:hypothetical protein